jgi:hypothetical protein
MLELQRVKCGYFECKHHDLIAAGAMPKDMFSVGAMQEKLLRQRGE